MPGRNIERRYWDSFCFIALLNNEPVANECVRILEEAKQEKHLIVVSTLVLVEVVRPKGASSPLPSAEEMRIREFFENDYIRM